MDNQEKAKKFFLEGINLFTKKEFDKAIIEFKKSLELQPKRGSIILNLSKTYFKVKNYMKAKEHLEKLISFNVSLEEKKEALSLLYEVYINLDDIHGIEKLKKISSSEDYFDDFTKMKVNLYYPKLFDSVDQIKNFRKGYSENIKKILYEESLNTLNLEKNPLVPPNFWLSYDGQDNLEINKKFTKLFKKIYPELNQLDLKDTVRNKKIKIGFISEFFTNHTILKLFEGIIYKLDKSKFDVYIFYSDKTLPGTRYEELKRNSMMYDYENVFLPENFYQKVNLIKEQCLDILFYTDIHMSQNLYYLTLIRLAKIQMTSWGHPETTGNSKIDYFLSSKFLEIKDCQKRYSEKVLLSNYLPMYFYKPKVINQLREDLMVKKNIYSCPQNLIKMHPSFDLAINKILKKDKKAEIYFIKDSNEELTKKFFNRLKKTVTTNIDRIYFKEKLTVEHFINDCGKSSVLLDPFIFGAGNSFHESMYYGTPTVTMPTKYLKSRIVTGAYNQMEIENPPIAKEVEEYVDLCVEFANNVNLDLKKYYSEQANKNLFENEKVIQDLELKFESIVNN